MADKSIVERVSDIMETAVRENGGDGWRVEDNCGYLDLTANISAENVEEAYEQIVQRLDEAGLTPTAVYYTVRFSVGL